MVGYPVQVVGESNYQSAVRTLRAGQPMRLVHEPNNPYDQRAVSVRTTRGKIVGYLPRGSWVTEVLLDQELPVDASVLEVSSGQAGQRGVVLHVVVGAGDGVEVRGYDFAAGRSIGERAGAAAVASHKEQKASGGTGCAIGAALLIALPVAPGLGWLMT